jgi:type VI secretion system secreted protein Hcp
MAVNIHIKLTNIEGEATDPKFDKAITVLGYNWGVASPSASNLGTGSPATHRLRAQDLTFTKRADKATTQLLDAMARNTTIPKAVLTLTKAGGKDPVDFLVITLSQVRVSGIRSKCSEEDEDYSEEVSLSFARFTEEYFTQDSKGKSKPTGVAEVDFAPSV